MDTGPEQSATDTTDTAAESLGALHRASDAGAQSPSLWSARQNHEPFARFRRRLDRIRLDVDAANPRAVVGEEAELQLEVTLLREENARLKASRHQPSDVGRLIEQLRLIAEERDEAEALDEAWSLLTECLLIREGLERACTEIQAAIGTVQRRLQALSLNVAETSPVVASQRSAVANDPPAGAVANGSSPHPNGSAPHTSGSSLQTNGSAPHTNGSSPHTNGSSPHPNGSASHPNGSAPHAVADGSAGSAVGNGAGSR